MPNGISREDVADSVLKVTEALPIRVQGLGELCTEDPVGKLFFYEVETFSQEERKKFLIVADDRFNIEPEDKSQLRGADLSRKFFVLDAEGENIIGAVYHTDDREWKIRKNKEINTAVFKIEDRTTEQDIHFISYDKSGAKIDNLSGVAKINPSDMDMIKNLPVAFKDNFTPLIFDQQSVIMDTQSFLAQRSKE